ncbi:hypothetical protein ACN47E_000330 [Coniothyrium glycines]
MAQKLLDLPLELLINILGHLPVRSLLHFSETSQYSRFLANSNLQTLKLGVRSPRSRNIIRTGSERINIRIKDALDYDYTTLLNFHTTLVQGIIVRHADMLHTLDLSLWTLTKPIAEAITKVSALRNLSIRLEEDVYVRAVPRSCVARDRIEQDRAWTLLVESATWKYRLRSLKLESTEITTEQLTTLLDGSRQCAELHLSRCRYVTSEVWDLLGNQSWSGRLALRKLTLDESGGVLKDAAFQAISLLVGLQHLDLYGCYGTNRDDVAQWNKDAWHITSLILPAEECDGDGVILEVDPAYMVPVTTAS